MKSTFAKSSLQLLVLTTMANAVNYLCQILMGRVLPAEAFGRINAIFSFIAILGVLGTGLNSLASKYTAEHKGESGNVKNVIRSVLMMALYILLAVAALMLLLQGVVKPMLGIESPLLYGALIGVVITGVVQPVYLGVFAGLGRFVTVGLLSLVIPGFKLVSVLLLGRGKMGDGESFVLFGIVLGAAIGVVLGEILLRRHGLGFPRRKLEQAPALHFASSSAAVIGVNVLFIFFANADVLFVNMLIGADAAGEYSSIMLFGRIIFYCVTALITVMLPTVARANKAGAGTFVYLKKSLLFTVALSALCFIPLNLWPGFFLDLIYGGRYPGGADFVLWVSAISFLLAVTNIFLTYLVGISRYKALLISLGAAAAALIVLVLLFHGSIAQILLNIILALAAEAVFCAVYCFGPIRKEAKNEI